MRVGKHNIVVDVIAGNVVSVWVAEPAVLQRKRGGVTMSQALGVHDIVVRVERSDLPSAEPGVTRSVFSTRLLPA
jgi:hypothetical protein